MKQPTVTMSVEWPSGDSEAGEKACEAISQILIRALTKKQLALLMEQLRKQAQKLWLEEQKASGKLKDVDR